MNLFIPARKLSVTKDSMRAPRRPSIRHDLLRASVIAVVGCVAAFTSVAAAPGISAAPVACNAASLVSALAAVSGSGQSGTVTLTPSCTYTMTAVDNTVDGENAFPDILGSVTVVGNGATITRSTSGGTPDFRFFIVDDGGSLDLSNVTLSNGSIPSGDIHGGGAVLSRSVLTVTAVTFLNNQSMGSTGGGAIDNHDTGQLTVTRSTFTGNSALQGGAIEDEATLCHTSVQVCGQATITDSTFTNNSSSVNGGGAFESQLDGPNPALICTPPWPQAASCQEAGGAHDTLIGDTFSGNMAMTEGGAIANFGTTTVSNSTLYNNGITGTSTAGDGGGGGIQNTGSISITQSTLAANESQFGANVHDFNDTANQTSPPTTALGMSIVTGGITGANCGGSIAIVDNGYNLDSGTSCGFSNHALNSTAPKLGALASNGGPTQTMALMSGSPAIDAIPSGFAGCSGSGDQRGVNRPQGGACDIGAFEVDTTPPTAPTALSANGTSVPSVILAWNSSTDNVGVTGYTIYRNGTKLTTVGGTTLTFTDTTVGGSTSYSYTVDAFDAALNHSAQSTAATTSTLEVMNALGGGLTSAPDAVSVGSNQTAVFVRGSDNALWYRMRTGSTWTAWQYLGGVLSSAPSAVSWGPNRIDVFVRGGDNALWYRTWNGTTWSGWQSLGGIITSAPDAASWGIGNLEVFGRGGDGSLWLRSWNGTTWNGWQPLGGILKGEASAVSTAGNKMDVFVRGGDDGLWERSWNGTNWTAWQSHGGIISADPNAVSTGSGSLDVFVRGGDNALWLRAWNGTSWSWQYRGGILKSAPEAVSCTAGHADVFIIGADNGLWQLGFDGTSWHGFRPLGGQWSYGPSAICESGQADIFVRSISDGLWETTNPAS